MATIDMIKLKLLDKMPNELVQYLVEAALGFLTKIKSTFDSVELLSVIVLYPQIFEDEGLIITLEDIRSLKDSLLTSLRICRNKKYSPEVFNMYFSGLSEEKQGIISKAIESLVLCLNKQGKTKEDVIHNEQLVDVKWNLKYILQTREHKQVNVPLINLQLLIADINGDIRTEYFNMTLAEFQGFKGEIQKIAEILK